MSFSDTCQGIVSCIQLVSNVWNADGRINRLAVVPPGLEARATVCTSCFSGVATSWKFDGAALELRYAAWQVGHSKSGPHCMSWSDTCQFAFSSVWNADGRSGRSAVVSLGLEALATVRNVRSTGVATSRKFVGAALKLGCSNSDS